MNMLCHEFGAENHACMPHPLYLCFWKLWYLGTCKHWTAFSKSFAGKLVPSLSYNKIKWDIRRVEVKGHTAYGTLQLFTSENNYFKSFIPENELFMSFLWSICDDPDAFANCYVMD